MQEETNKTKYLDVVSINFPLAIYTSSKFRLLIFWPRDTLYPQKLALTSLTSGSRSVCIVRLRTKVHGV
jgi:hypothetical protein